MLKKLIVLMLLISSFSMILAQDTMPEAQATEIEAGDGLILKGDFYHSDEMMETGSPAVLLLHMLGSERSAYEPLIPHLLDAGYAVLNVDMRGHGETGGSQDWSLAEGDMQGWLDWLREQDGVNPAAVATIGASIGSNMALIACANDAECVTAIALSPGLDYRGVAPADATATLGERSALLIASQDDRYSADSVREMFMNNTGNITARLYSGRAHGTRLFDNDLESVSQAIIAWLDEHLKIAPEM